MINDSQKEQVSTDRLPVTVLSGFLGAGKTTLLNHILNLLRSTADTGHIYATTKIVAQQPANPR